MRRLKENPVVFTEIILLILFMVLVIWIGVGEDPGENLKALQGLLVVLNIIALIISPFIVSYIEGRPSKAARERMKQLKLENSKEYREKNVFRITVENDFFGTCVFEKDINKDYVIHIEGIEKRNYDKYKIEVEMQVSEEMIGSALEALEKLYKEAESILDKIYQAAMVQCNDWEETDAEGNPISLEYVKKNYWLNRIWVNSYQDRIFVDMDGGIGDENGGLLLGDHAFFAEIDCSTGEITYSLQG